MDQRAVEQQLVDTIGEIRLRFMQYAAQHGFVTKEKQCEIFRNVLIDTLLINIVVADGRIGHIPSDEFKRYADEIILQFEGKINHFLVQISAFQKHNKPAAKTDSIQEAIDRIMGKDKKC